MRLFIVLLCCFFFLPAFSQETPKESLDNQAFLFFQAGDYSEALRLWQQDYTQRKDPQTLFNLSSCYKALGDYIKAEQVFSAWLATIENPGIRATFQVEWRSLQHMAHLQRETAQLREQTKQLEALIELQTTPPPRKKLLFWGGVGAAGTAAIGTALFFLLKPPKIPSIGEADVVFPSGGTQ